MALIIRKRGDGSVEIEGDPPETHALAPGWVSRELGSSCELQIRIAGVTYDVVAITPDGWQLQKRRKGGK